MSISVQNPPFLGNLPEYGDPSFFSRTCFKLTTGIPRVTSFNKIEFPSSRNSSCSVLETDYSCRVDWKSPDLLNRTLPDKDCESFQMKIPTSWDPIGFIESEDFYQLRFFHVQFWLDAALYGAKNDEVRHLVSILCDRFKFLETFLKIKMSSYHIQLRFSSLQKLRIVSRIHNAYLLISSWLLEAFSLCLSELESEVI